ncbi:MAG: hypothetical protein G01um101431_305 [Parcubacteria group bacterium Gr01-1014_31]|nr:MAG: hypothetical protein G01um101431_305 [Parcubacteria group bacterium Gr01-1014_31]
MSDSRYEDSPDEPENDVEYEERWDDGGDEDPVLDPIPWALLLGILCILLGIIIGGLYMLRYAK